MKLFEPFRLGELALRNRVVMASMTRGRTTDPGHVPGELQIEYYRQRAGAGLIVTEGTWVSREAIGFVHAPGLFTAAQAAGWRRVTEAVHREGGLIFAQLAHSGAVSHPDFFAGAAPLAPSAVNPRLRAFTPDGFKDTVTPRAMSPEDIRRTIDDYREAARHALAAGFDGIELHAATTYLLPQFLNGTLNLRDDAYGGSAAKRSRIVLEVLADLIEVWGPGRVGLKLSPTAAQGGFQPDAQTVDTYDHLLRALDALPLSHLQVVRALDAPELAPLPAPAWPMRDTLAFVRERFGGTLIANGGFDAARANRLLEDGGAELVSFARPYIGNPDLVARFERDLPLTTPDPTSFYQGGARGYLDYPRAG
ncbi:alkene reductase [Burkholderia gladioli]|uniref:alkene reductase n=1 Tax=Burkholderia gladioli TaxID=28095 RepID=UPI00164203E0|nr:alkene reductase [Burkholderia gladioli]